MWTAIIIGVLLFAGAITHKTTGKNDSGGEQFIETILQVEGVNIDFSADDKAKEQKQMEATPNSTHPVD